MIKCGMGKFREQDKSNEQRRKPEKAQRECAFPVVCKCLIFQKLEQWNRVDKKDV
jgi:hypothetical protein